MLKNLQLFRLAVHAAGFLPEQYVTRIGPHYSQYLLNRIYESMRANPLMFSNLSEDSVVLTNSRGCAKLGGVRKAIVILDSDAPLGKHDHKGVVAIDFANFGKSIVNAHVVKKLPPYDLDDLVDFPSMSPSRYNMFVFTVFCETLGEFIDIYNYWKDQDKFVGTLYCFYMQRELQDQILLSDLELFMRENKGRAVRLLNVFFTPRTVLYRALQESVFSLHLTPNTIYPFWAARMKCYPVVRDNDVFSAYVKHVDTDEKFIEIIEAFWNAPNELQLLVRGLNNLNYPTFDLSTLIGVETMKVLYETMA